MKNLLVAEMGVLNFLLQHLPVLQHHVHHLFQFLILLLLDLPGPLHCYVLGKNAVVVFGQVDIGFDFCF